MECFVKSAVGIERSDVLLVCIMLFGQHAILAGCAVFFLVIYELDTP